MAADYQTKLLRHDDEDEAVLVPQEWVEKLQNLENDSRLIGSNLTKGKMLAALEQAEGHSGMALGCRDAVP